MLNFLNARNLEKGRFKKVLRISEIKGGFHGSHYH